MPLQDLIQEMQRVYKDLPLGLCYLDTDLRFIQINDWLAEINGIPAEEHLGRTIGELIPDVAAGVEIQFRQVIDTGEPIIGGSVEAENSAQPGIKRHFQYSCYPVRSDDGEVIGISCVVEDVTVRNEALCESEDRFRDFVEAASDWFWEMDENLRFTYLADSLLEIGGSKPEDLLGKTWQEADPGYEDNEDWRRQLACLKARRVFRNFQYHCVMPDGSIRHYSTSGTPIFDRAGHFKGYRGVGSDITERKHTEVALQESEERLSSFINNIPNSIYLKDTEGRYVLVNDSAMKQYGLPKNRLIGKTVYDLHPKGEADATVKQDREVLKQGVPIETERELTFPDGSNHTIVAVKFPVRGQSGEIMGIGGINIDITERKRAEEELAALNENLEKRVEERTRALRDSEARLKAILDNSPAAIYLKDLEGRFLLANKAYLNWVNLELKDVQGKTSYEIFPKEAAEAYVSQDKETIETRAVVTREIEKPLHGGGTRSIVVTKFPVLSPEGTLVAIGGIDVDITERKRLEGELLRQERMATLGQLTATVSHELRNPLGVIRTSNFILRDGLNGEIPRVKRALERIDRSVIRCDRIIDELLDFTRIRDLEPEATAIDVWLGDLLDEQPLPEDVKLCREFGAPEASVSRAVINVFENACQAITGTGDERAGLGKGVLTIKTRQSQGRAEVIFEDNGPGIAPDVLPRIFEPLFSTKGFGVGLGLPVVKQIMEQHGGGIEVETEEGRGTRFVLRLPTRRPEGEVS